MRAAPPRILGLALATVVAAVSSACSGVTHGSAPARTPSAATVGAPTPSVTPTAKVPNPFKVVARYSVASLGLKQPNDFAIGPDGNVYITDFVAQGVTVISPAGKVLRRWGTKGKAPGQFSFHLDGFGNPHASIAVGPDGKVYVGDSGNCRVEVFSPDGAFLRQFGKCGYENNYEFVEVQNLALDADNDLYVTDGERNTISKFSPTGTFVWRVGGSESSDPHFRGLIPDSVFFHSVDVHGRIVVALDGHQSIAYLDHAGRVVDTFTTTGLFRNDWAPCDVTVNSQGYTVVQSCPNAGQAVPGVPDYQATLLFDRSHRLVGAWDGSPFFDFGSVRFGPHGEAFAFGAVGQSVIKWILEVKVQAPGA